MSSLRIRFGLEAEVRGPARHRSARRQPRTARNRAKSSIAGITSALATSPASASPSTTSAARPPSPDGVSASPATARNIWFPTTRRRWVADDLLLGQKLSPKTVLFIRFDAQRARGRAADPRKPRTDLGGRRPGPPVRRAARRLADPAVRQPGGPLPLQRGVSR